MIKNEFNLLCDEMIQALKSGKMPTEEVLPILQEQFDAFPLDLQNLLVDLGIVKKQRCEVWSRVMGYLRPVNQWNKGKKQEHAERNHFEQFQVQKVVDPNRGDMQ